MKSLFYILFVAGWGLAGIQYFNRSDAHVPTTDTLIVKDTVIPPPVIKWLTPREVTSITPFQDTVYVPVFDTLAIERTFFENDSFQYFITSADFDRDGDSVTVETVVFPNIHVPELELRFVQKAQWNPQSFKIVTNTLVLPKPLPLVQIKPSITVGLDMRLKPNVVAGVGVVFNL